MNHIQVYAPNLKCRKDRKLSIQLQFVDKPEFELHVIPAIEMKDGAHALWQTFYAIVEKEAKSDSPFFVFCEDDHVFTENYTFDYLQSQIEAADRMNADLLSGGMSWLLHPIQVTEKLFWVATFNGMQFTVVFRRFYQRILAAKTTQGYVTDFRLSALSHRKFVMYPYISVQKEFGYSDVTTGNDRDGFVEGAFENSQNLLQKLQKVKSFYAQLPQQTVSAVLQSDVTGVCIPTYVIHLPEHIDRYEHLSAQFRGRKEFDLHWVNACKHEVGAYGLWQSIRKVVQQAYDNDEQLILICEDDHAFTRHYHREQFLHQVMLAGVMGAQLLSGGIGGMSNLVPLRHGLYWMNDFWCTQFIVLYRSAFLPILQADFSLRDVADEKLASILTRKMAIVPFISEQSDFGYSDVTEDNDSSGKIRWHFDTVRDNLKHYDYAFRHFLSDSSSKETDWPSLQDYLKSDCAHKLHVGCGQHVLSDWYNVDLEPSYGAAFMDLLQPLQVPESSFDEIFSEHCIDTFSFEDSVNVLREFHRILKDGGTLRLVMYSLERVQGLLTESIDEDSMSYAKWALSVISRRKDIPADNLPLSLVVAGFVSSHAKSRLYNWKDVKSILQLAGFTSVRMIERGSQADTYFRTIEHHRFYVPSWAYAFETIRVEAQK